MKHRLLRIYWTLFGWPDLPPKFHLKPKVNQYTGRTYYPKYYGMVSFYLTGHPIEEIAPMYNVTNERVKQCIWKAYRESVK